MMILLNLFIFSILCYASGSGDECVPSVHPPERKSRCCGVAPSSSRILSGFLAAIDEYPWMALVEYRRGNKTILQCSAVLISGRYALSAAHCFPADAESYGTPINIRLGDYDITNEGLDCVDEAGGSKDCNDGALTIPIEKVIKHPEFRQGGRKGHEHNIALIKLKETAPYTDFIRPICLPTSDVTLATKEGSVLRRFMLAGWGLVNEPSQLTTRDILHHVHVPLVDSATCNSEYKGLVEVENRQLCAGGKGRGSCNGDSGSPLMYSGDDDTSELVGIVSLGPRVCGTIGIPDVYTKIFPYLAWIQGLTGVD